MDHLRDELCETKVALGQASFRLDATVNAMRKRDQQILHVLEGPRPGKQTLAKLATFVRSTSATYLSPEDFG